MPLDQNKQPIHSEKYLYGERDIWWNDDFLELLAKRLNLKKYSSLVDIGIGRGHWSKRLLPFLNTPFSMVGVDIEEEWINKVSNEFSNYFPDLPKETFTFVQGDAQSLPLESDAYDIVTCQTVLMHLPNPTQALKEMLRITKKGGLVICVEPVNLLNRIELSSCNHNITINEQAAIFKFWSYFHLGKRKTGQGDNDIGMYLPSLFKVVGLEDIRTYQNDRVLPEFNYKLNVEEILVSTDDINTAKEGGATDNDINAVLSALESISQQSKDGISTTGLLNMIVCAGVKV